MAKPRTLYFCQQCGQQSAKWVGKCPSCGQWNTFVEEVIDRETEKGKEKRPVYHDREVKPRLLDEIEAEESVRINTRDPELNRVLGGGIVPGSLVLIGGEPGIGKSTLLLQIGLQLEGFRVLYVSGEESEVQIRLRARRIGKEAPHFYLLTETHTQSILKHCKELEPDVLVIDSIQTLYTAFIESPPGSVSQVRECAAELQRFAKETHTPVFIIGHVTKDGSLAGPKVLEHVVDTVLQFEGDSSNQFRILRSTKNRFGSASELGIYEMMSSGLRPVQNPSELLLTQRTDAFSGIAVGAMIEGQRPLMIEVQALVAPAFYGTPQRSATGFDPRRLHMLLAVLEKRCGFRLGTQDVFLNIAGGLRVDDPALDLAVVSAIVSSHEDAPLSMQHAFAAEVGLSGEIRNVGRLEQRIDEAEKLGFTRIFVSSAARTMESRPRQIEVVMLEKVQDLISHILRR